MAFWILILPLFTSLLCGVFNPSLPVRVVKISSVSFMFIASLLSITIFLEQVQNDHLVYNIFYEFLSVGFLKVSIGAYVDRLTATMYCIVTIISTIIHIYSFGYMENDRTLNKFLSYLSFFTFCMLLLVSADNLLQLFIGWEGVGLCSYLLIGYYYKKGSACRASMKAFITNRISDFAFVIGIILLCLYTESMEFDVIFSSIVNMKGAKINLFGFKYDLIETMGLLLFIGCMGKSAQIGFHVWLPDAMEGPTPVSALIHAATMVTAGVFLLARMSPVLEYAPLVRDFITIIGSITCLSMAMIAVTQNDIKKIIAYSTCSQLGLMFIACGLSHYNIAIFHLSTHAFFKALLFLGAGNVIHMSHEQDLKKIGGLKTQMPITMLYFAIGLLALIGIYPLAGYFSKDIIIEYASSSMSHYGHFAYIASLLGVLFTALYSSKLFIGIFFGNKQIKQIKEAPIIMNAPLILLAFGSIFLGMYAVYHLYVGEYFFANSIYVADRSSNLLNEDSIESLYPIILGLCGMFIGILIYQVQIFSASFWINNILYKLFKNKLYFDQLYYHLLIKPYYHLAVIAGESDINLIDYHGPVRAQKIVKSMSLKFSRLQNGYIYFYILISILCLTASFVYLIMIRY